MTRKTLSPFTCIFTCVMLASVSATSTAQTINPPNSRKQNRSPQIRWEGIDGTSKGTPNEFFCLTGNGQFVAPTSRNIDKLISTWLAKHPHAENVRVATFGPVTRDQPTSRQTYIWVVDGKTTLNEYLVRRGACPGGTMQIPDFSSFPSTDGKVGGQPFHFKIYVSPQQEQRFLKRIEQAEAEAQREHLGVWKNGTADVY